jgi:hypothetical protein
LNSLSTNSILSINNLNNKTNFSNLLVSNASTLLSSLNVVGNIIGSGTALTNLNYNSILNPPSSISFNNPSTFISTLNISGNATLNNVSTCVSSLNVSGTTTLSNKVYINAATPNGDSTLDVGGTSASTYYTYLNGLRLSGRDISMYQNVANSPLTFHTKWGSTSNDYISFNTRATARLTIDGGGGITCNSDSLNFPNLINQYKINLYGTNS